MTYSRSIRLVVLSFSTNNKAYSSACLLAAQLDLLRKESSHFITQHLLLFVLKALVHIVV
jgi:hypothetical protein